MSWQPQAYRLCELSLLSQKKVGEGLPIIMLFYNVFSPCFSSMGSWVTHTSLCVMGDSCLHLDWIKIHLVIDETHISVFL